MGRSSPGVLVQLADQAVGQVGERLADVVLLQGFRCPGVLDDTESGGRHGLEKLHVGFVGGQEFIGVELNARVFRVPRLARNGVQQVALAV